MKVLKKWRPPLWLVVATVIGMVLCLPLAGLFLFNFYSKQLVQQTEEALIAQATVLAAVMARDFEDLGGDPEIGHQKPPDAKQSKNSRYDPIFPTLSVRPATIAKPRPDARPALRSNPLMVQIGQGLSGVTERTQERTLAGFRVLGPTGTVIGGTAELGTSLGHVPEVKRALEGRPTTLLRMRDASEPRGMPFSLNRSTAFRVYVALPVVVRDRVIGAIYLSRTPGNIVQYMFLERANLGRATLAVLGAALVIGFLFWRFITRPIYGLIEETEAISTGVAQTVAPLPHYGTREVAKLGQSFISMADALQKRADGVETFTAHVTHELKSPLTSILGAAELLSDGSPNEEMRQKFLANITADAERMTLLLERLRRLASARIGTTSGSTSLTQVVSALSERFEGLNITYREEDAPFSISTEDLTIVLTHMAENSVQHGATTFDLTQSDAYLTICDNGSGVSRENASRIFDPFFTTRRDLGGTGMGLGIVTAILEANGASIQPLKSDAGAMFEIEFRSKPD